MAEIRDRCIMRINFYPYDGEIKTYIHKSTVNKIKKELKGKQKLNLNIEKPLFGITGIKIDCPGENEILIIKDAVITKTNGILEIWQDSENRIHKILISQSNKNYSIKKYFQNTSFTKIKFT
jgi:hypothetical protein